jgi:cytochrome c551/c552
MNYTKNPARLAANVAAHVANGAKVGPVNRKVAARLAGRVADYEITVRNAKNDAAKGYHRPGSMQK